MDGLQAPPHGGREVRSYTANSPELRCGVVAVKVAYVACLRVAVVSVRPILSGRCSWPCVVRPIFQQPVKQAG